MTNRKNLPARQGKSRAEILDLMKPVSARCDPQQEAQNAALVAFELDAVSEKVSRFGWRDMDPRMKDRLTDDWVDVLREYPIAEVRRGISDCLDLQSRCPTENEVKAAVMRRRRMALERTPAIPEPSEPLVQITDEERAERKRFSDNVVKGAGYALNVKKG